MNVSIIRYPCIASLIFDSIDRKLVPILTESGYSAISMDHRGLGNSDVNFSSFGAHDCGSDIVQLIDEQLATDQKAVIVGDSMAGAAAVWAAAERPQKVQGIVLVNAFVRDLPMPFGVPTLLGILLNDWTGPGFWSM